MLAPFEEPILPPSPPTTSSPLPEQRARAEPSTVDRPTPATTTTTAATPTRRRSTRHAPLPSPDPSPAKTVPATGSKPSSAGKADGVRASPGGKENVPPTPSSSSGGLLDLVMYDSDEDDDAVELNIRPASSTASSSSSNAAPQRLKRGRTPSTLDLASSRRKLVRSESCTSTLFLLPSRSPRFVRAGACRGHLARALVVVVPMPPRKEGRELTRLLASRPLPPPCPFLLPDASASAPSSAFASGLTSPSTSTTESVPAAVVDDDCLIIAAAPSPAQPSPARRATRSTASSSSTTTTTPDPPRRPSAVRSRVLPEFTLPAGGLATPPKTPSKPARKGALRTPTKPAATAARPTPERRELKPSLYARARALLRCSSSTLTTSSAAAAAAAATAAAGEGGPPLLASVPEDEAAGAGALIGRSAEYAALTSFLVPALAPPPSRGGGHHPATKTMYVAGPPGTGKTALVSRLADQERSKGTTVGVVNCFTAAAGPGGRAMWERVGEELFGEDTWKKGAGRDGVVKGLREAKGRKLCVAPSLPLLARDCRRG